MFILTHTSTTTTVMSFIGYKPLKVWSQLQIIFDRMTLGSTTET